MPKEYPAEFKTKIIKRYQKGESIQSLSQELQLFVWIVGLSAAVCGQEIPHSAGTSAGT